MPKTDDSRSQNMDISTSDSEAKDATKLDGQQEGVNGGGSGCRGLSKSGGVDDEGRGGKSRGRGVCGQTAAGDVESDEDPGHISDEAEVCVLLASLCLRASNSHDAIYACRGLMIWCRRSLVSVCMSFSWVISRSHNLKQEHVSSLSAHLFFFCYVVHIQAALIAKIAEGTYFIPIHSNGRYDSFLKAPITSGCACLSLSHTASESLGETAVRRFRCVLDRFLGPDCHGLRPSVSCTFSSEQPPSSFTSREAIR